MQKMRTQQIVEAGVLIALSAVLSYVKIFRMPQGGSITAGSMIPLIVLALRHGPRTGIMAGIVLGLVHSVLDPFVVHPVQYLLDYPIAFGCLGLAGFFRKQPFVGAAVAIGGRFVAHVISGVVFFGSYAPKGSSVIGYSLVYNGSYLLPEVIISGLVVYLLSKSTQIIPTGR